MSAEEELEKEVAALEAELAALQALEEELEDEAARLRSAER